MEYEQINELFTRYLADQCSREEVLALLMCFNEAEHDALLRNLVLDALEHQSKGVHRNAKTKARFNTIYLRIQKRLDRHSK